MIPVHRPRACYGRGMDRTTEHPDEQTVATEEHVPNRAKAAPTQKGLINVLGVLTAVVAGVGIFLGVATNLWTPGIALTALAILAGLVLTAMAFGDQRAGAALPIAATVAGVVGTFILAVGVAAEEADGDLLNDAVVPEEARDVEVFKTD